MIDETEKLDMSGCSLYDYISDNRQFFMGLSILWIAWFHSLLNLSAYISNPYFSKALWILWATGYGGVDYFAFLSGFGLARSVEENDIL